MAASDPFPLGFPPPRQHYPPLAGIISIDPNWPRLIVGRFPELYPVLFIDNGGDYITWKEGANEC